MVSGSPLITLREAIEVCRGLVDEGFQLSYLLILVDAKLRPGTNQIEIAQRTGLSRAGVSRALERLGAFGKTGLQMSKAFVRVEPSPEDRRENLIFLTAEGERFLERVAEPLIVWKKNKKDGDS